ncbi:MAG: trypsin-like peptidase domain-containing protein [Pyrinomonadaceae bacterium]
MVETGDEIYVASNPKGLEGSFTKGIISSLRSDVGLFQIDAAISPGSSGGVLLNQKAQAIGIIKSSLISGQNLNFAIPINELKILPFKFKHSIQLAGACAYTDRDKEKLKGLVRKVTEKSPKKEVINGKLYESEPMTTSIYIYDLDGNQTELSLFDAVSGEFGVKYVSTYDENGLKISQIRELRNGKVQQTKFNLDDSINNKLYGRRFSGTLGSMEEQGGMQIYNSEGEMTTWYIGGKKLTFSYDSEGRKIESIQWSGEKVQIKTHFRYKNDRNGNWIEQYEFSNFPSVDDENEWHEGDTEYREITYYE